MTIAPPAPPLDPWAVYALPKPEFDRWWSEASEHERTVFFLWAEETAKPWRQDPATMSVHLAPHHFQRWAYWLLLGHKFRQAVTGESPRQLWMLPPRYGKPVGVDALVLMGDGTRKRLGDIAVGDEVVSHLGRPRRVTAVHEQGHLPSVTITTVGGRVTTAALDHPFLTPRGYVEAAKLVPCGNGLGATWGDVLATVAEPVVAVTTGRSNEEFRLAGYFIGDGSVGRSASGAISANVTCFDPIERLDLIHCAETMGWGVNEDTERGRFGFRAGESGRRNGPRPWLEAAGIAGHTSWTKRVPEWVFTAAAEQLAQFIGAYFACDGTVSGGRGEKRGRSVEFYSVAEGLMRDVQHLLLRLGIPTTLNGKNSTYREQAHRSWRLRVAGRDGIARFQERVPMHSAKAVRLAEMDPFRQSFDAALLSDPVASVEHVGEVECRCLTVEHDETFTADDLVVHNSTMASQWGPAWALDRDPTQKIILVSYGDDLADENARATRDLLAEHRTHLRAQLRPDVKRRDRFMTEQGGGVLGAGIGSAITGFGANGAVLDDPFKNWQEAHSEAKREAVDMAYKAVIRTRLEGDNPWQIVPMCMTGDTPVLRPDGSTTRLCDIRPGDIIATYGDAQLTTSTVVNWANQGPDEVYEVRMMSGRKVRANGRHPFRVVDESGVATWVRLESLKAGMRVRSVVAPIPASNVRPRSATLPPNARDCACPITARRDTPQAIGLPRPVTRDAARSGSKGDTESRLRITTANSSNRTAYAPSATA